jgi:hypothetical protein
MLLEFLPRLDSSESLMSGNETTLNFAAPERQYVRYVRYIDALSLRGGLFENRLIVSS